MSFIDDILTGNNNPSAGYIEFLSSDHIRYHNGIDVSGHNYNCHRKIKIENSITQSDGYTVTIFNEDGVHPIWRTNVQMSPKRMRIVRASSSCIEFRGGVQTGYMYAYRNGYDIAVQFDGDGQHNASYLDNMSKKLIEDNLDMVIGSRYIEKEGFQSTFMRRVGILYFTKIIHWLTKATITDPTSGFRMANRKVIEMFAKDYPRDYPEPESVVCLLKNNLKVVEVPVQMKARQGGESSIKLWDSVYYMIKVSLAIFVECSRKHKENK